MGSLLFIFNKSHKRPLKWTKYYENVSDKKNIYKRLIKFERRPGKFYVQDTFEAYKEFGFIYMYHGLTSNGTDLLNSRNCCFVALINSLIDE